jgi:hypothetical protein
MRYQIVLEGKGGELDRCGVEAEEEIREAALALIAACPYLAGGDMIRVVDMEEPQDDIDELYMTA